MHQCVIDRWGALHVRCLRPPRYQRSAGSFAARMGLWTDVPLLCSRRSRYLERAGCVAVHQSVTSVCWCTACWGRTARSLLAPPDSSPATHCWLVSRAVGCAGHCCPCEKKQAQALVQTNTCRRTHPSPSLASVAVGVRQYLSEVALDRMLKSSIQFVSTQAWCLEHISL